MPRKRVSNIVKEADDISRVLTGQRLPYWLKRAWEELRRSKPQEAVETAPAEDPYAVLGLDPSCIPADIVSRYRELARKYHPDGSEPDPEKFKRIQEAYEELCRQRNIR